MWCRNCQQDVPAVASVEDDTRICCARCNQPVAGFDECDSPRAEARDADEFKPAEQQETRPQHDSPTQPPVNFDDWELEDELRSVERLVAALDAGSANANNRDRRYRGEPPHNVIPGWHVGRTPNEETTKHPKQPPRAQRSGFIPWTVLLLGLMTFVCGAVLLGWSFVTGRGELWSLGIPLTLAGQAGLIVGLVLQLEGLWQTNRQTVAALESFEKRLIDLQHATTLLSSTHSSSAQSFYAHMAEDASPQLLLADLKGQLDMLAMRMGRQQ